MQLHNEIKNNRDRAHACNFTNCLFSCDSIRTSRPDKLFRFHEPWHFTSWIQSANAKIFKRKKKDFCKSHQKCANKAGILNECTKKRKKTVQNDASHEWNSMATKNSGHRCIYRRGFRVFRYSAMNHYSAAYKIYYITVPSWIRENPEFIINPWDFCLCSITGPFIARSNPFVSGSTFKVTFFRSARSTFFCTVDAPKCKTNTTNNKPNKNRIRRRRQKNQERQVPPVTVWFVFFFFGGSEFVGLFKLSVCTAYISSKKIVSRGQRKARPAGKVKSSTTWY